MPPSQTRQNLLSMTGRQEAGEKTIKKKKRKKETSREVWVGTRASETGERLKWQEAEHRFPPLMRDNKQSNSTAYGGVQAGRCSKRPLRSLPYGVTNCCFFFGFLFFFSRLRQGGAPKEKLKRGRKKNGSGAKVGIVLMSHFVFSLQIEPEGSAALLMVLADSGERPLNLARRTLLRAGVLGVDVIGLREHVQSESGLH